MYGNSIWDEFKERMSQSNDTLVKIILVNAIIFFLVYFIHVVLLLTGTGIDFARLANIWLALPPAIIDALLKPWTFLTYQFMHAGVFHILFNMIVLYWSGRLFQEYLGNHRFLATYLLGGIAGGLMYLAAFQVFPHLQELRPSLGMVGASASVFAILVAIGTYLPNYTIHLIFFGGVRLKYIILVLIAIDLVSLAGRNAGGHFAHLGGALFGFVYTRQLIRGQDLSGWLTNLIGKIKDWFTGSRIRERTSGFKVHRTESAKTQKQVEQEEIDRILDKIAQSGYSSLTDAEKNTLFKASKKD